MRAQKIGGLDLLGSQRRLCQADGPQPEPSHMQISVELHADPRPNCFDYASGAVEKSKKLGKEKLFEIQGIHCLKSRISALCKAKLMSCQNHTTAYCKVHKLLEAVASLDGGTPCRRLEAYGIKSGHTVSSIPSGRARGTSQTASTVAVESLTEIASVESYLIIVCTKDHDARRRFRQDHDYTT